MPKLIPKHIPSLLVVFDKVNNKYFNGLVCAGIKWGRLTTTTEHVIWGRTEFSTRIITINNILQHPDVPDYVLEAIVLHECLHLIYPPSVAAHDGHKDTTHNDRFLAMEKMFPIIEQSRKWEEDNYESLASQYNKNRKKKVKGE